MTKHLLSGEVLENFLEEMDNLSSQLYEDEYDDEDNEPVQPLEKPSPETIKSLLRQRLNAHDYRIEDVYTLRRLYYFYQTADDETHAREFVEQQAPLLLTYTPPSEHYDTQIALAVFQAEIDDYAPASLLAIRSAIEARPVIQQDSYDWRHLAQLAHQQGDYELERACYGFIEQIYTANQTTHPDDDDPSASDMLQANLSLDKASSWQAQGDTAQAIEHVDKAYQVIKNSYQQQKIDTNDWLGFAERILAIDTARLDDVVATSYQQLDSTLSQPLKRCFEVKIARLKATTLYAQGKLAEAIEQAKRGYFALTDDYGEPDIAHQLMAWLAEAGRTEELITIMFERYSRITDDEQKAEIFDLTQKLLKDGVQHTKLALLLADMGNNHEIGDVFDNSLPQGVALRGDESAESWYRRHLDLARQWAGGDVALQGLVDFELIEYDYYRQRRQDKPLDYQAILGRLEPALKKCPNHVFANIIEILLIARIHVLGVEQVLKAEFIPTTGALASYIVGAGFEESVSEYVNTLPDWTEEAEEQFKKGYYEHGLRLFEQFFNTGIGHYRSADVHNYSMLCNNLAIIYLNEEEAYDEAIELHKKGIASSPFAEHYDGIANNYWCKDDFANYIQASEDLWFFARQYGYSRYKLATKITRTAWAYNIENRHDEIATWLPRLEEWWQERQEYLEDDEQATAHEDYLDGLACALGHLSYEDSMQADTITRLEMILPELRQYKSIFGIRHAGLCYDYAGQHEKALALYQEALSYADPNQDYDSGQIEIIEEWIEDLQQRMTQANPVSEPIASTNAVENGDNSPKKSWWKFW